MFYFLFFLLEVRFKSFRWKVPTRCCTQMFMTSKGRSAYYVFFNTCGCTFWHGHALWHLLHDMDLKMTSFGCFVFNTLPALPPFRLWDGLDHNGTSLENRKLADLDPDLSQVGEVEIGTPVDSPNWSLATGVETGARSQEQNIMFMEPVQVQKQQGFKIYLFVAGLGNGGWKLLLGMRCSCCNLKMTPSEVWFFQVMAMMIGLYPFLCWSKRHIETLTSVSIPTIACEDISEAAKINHWGSLQFITPPILVTKMGDFTGTTAIRFSAPAAVSSCTCCPAAWRQGGDQPQGFSAGDLAAGKGPQTWWLEMHMMHAMCYVYATVTSMGKSHLFSMHLYTYLFTYLYAYLYAYLYYMLVTECSYN